MSPSTRRAWVEMSDSFLSSSAQLSPSTRRAWVEIFTLHLYYTLIFVALYAEGVGRNQPPLQKLGLGYVALYAEGVGRNWNPFMAR